MEPPAGAPPATGSTSTEAPGSQEPTESEEAAATTAPSAEASGAEDPAPGPEAVEGRWCSADADDDSAMACFTVELPTVTYDDGTAYDITAHDSPWDHGDGVFEYAMEDAPFGTYYPAGVPLEGYDGSYGPDPIDQDRIWNSQAGPLALRVED
ncbi:hypothetical protein [Brachybacterium hainanense]|uniref:Uncharacterized protein n=1 Tax=Brachybacterium hainanense TaxID=1541174 RepID=A0ABV6RAT3_9MICO